MMAIPGKKITITSSNVLDPVASIIEYASGTYALNEIRKITERTPGDATSYMGFIYKSLADANTTSPTDHENLWVRIGYLPYDDTRVYPENATITLNGQIFISNEIDNSTSPLNSDSKWSYLKEDNIHACIDYYFTTVTRQVNDDLVKEMEFGTSDTLNIFGIYGSHIKIEQLDVLNNDAVIQTNGIPHTDPASISDFATYLQFGSVGVVEVTDIDLGTQEFALVDTSSIHDFASYLKFQECGEVTNITMELIPKQTQKIRMTISKKAYKNMEIAEVATITVGNKMDVACTLYGIKSTRVALTPPKRDQWGDVSDTGDDYVKLYTGTMIVDSSKTEDMPKTVDYVDGLLDKLFNQPSTYYLTDDKHQTFNTFGLMQTSEISLEGVNEVSLPLKIESFKYKKNTKEC